MTAEPLISQQFKSANKFLWAINTYLELLHRDGPLVYGVGLKRLYALKSGIATLNDRDIEAITAKAAKMKLIPGNLKPFMVSCIAKNLELYAKDLRRQLQKRMVAIANGEVRNPDPLFKFSAEEARRYYYIPPHAFIQRVQKAIAEDFELKGYYSFSQPAVTTLKEVAVDAELTLTRMQISEGHLAPTETSWGALAKVIDDLVEIMEKESRYNGPDQDYTLRSRPCLKILWFIGKCLLGDLSPAPARRDVNLIDLDAKLNITDGTLAAIPFPLQQTMEVFSDYDGQNSIGVSMKGRFYLGAIAAVAFYHQDPEDNV